MNEGWGSSMVEHFTVGLEVEGSNPALYVALDNEYIFIKILSPPKVTSGGRGDLNLGSLDPPSKADTLS